ncbi:Rhotekin-2 [Sarcoptes scabiei]|uniref:Rhotekin-2 n=1 Tax=Sarcoptes scabiei TaxID=52283 RepID=A0A834VA44_SARSC|nr:Rhotekin-2 [Sarcoptes scabiei]
MREGTSKLLAACEHQNQSLEAAKSLLTSDLRLAEFKSELQRRKISLSSTSTSSRTTKNKSNEPLFKAKASVSNIRIPLIWKDTDYFKNRGDHRRFAVFCVLKIGTEIFDTIMVNVDRNFTDICFDDTFHFNNVTPDFNFELLIYSRVLHDDLSMASTHKKLTHKISNSLSRSFGRKMINLKDDFNNETGPKFYLIARASLNLKDSADLIKTYDLIPEEELDKNLQLPLFGHYCCRLAVQPECLLKDYHSDILRMHSPESDMFWAVLSKFRLNLWRIKTELQDEPAYLKHTNSKKEPDLIIPINCQSKVTLSERNIQLVNKENVFVFESINGQQSEWIKCFQKVRQDFQAWEPIAEYNMQLAPLSHHRSQYFFYERPSGSLYNETPLQDYDFLRKKHSKSFSYANKTNGTSQLYSLSSRPILD